MAGRPNTARHGTWIRAARAEQTGKVYGNRAGHGSRPGRGEPAVLAGFCPGEEVGVEPTVRRLALVKRYGDVTALDGLDLVV